MSLLKPIEGGRMYPGWWRWNPIGGCEHSCSYCSIKRIEKRANKDMTTPVFRKHYMKDDLGSGRDVFCCSSGDAFGEWVRDAWIEWMLSHCTEYPHNRYMFLTKNPAKYMSFMELEDLNCILGSTIETDIDEWDRMAGKAPFVRERLLEMGTARQWFPDLAMMISIEPVMKFTPELATILKFIRPDIIYVGVDSGKNGLPEPTADELRTLIAELRTFTLVRLKKGIERILPEARS